MSTSGIWAILPVKNIENAKQRLARALAPDERRQLFRAMVEDVVDALASSTRLAGIMVVTRDPEAIRLAERHGARVLLEEKNVGHTAASSLGATTLAKEGAVGMIQIPGDLPAVTPHDIDAVLTMHAKTPAITIVPSRDERGSNAVACSPPDLLPLRFGEDSFFPHVSRAKRLSVEPTIVRRDGIALDVDTPEDLQAFLTKPVDGRTYRYLVESGIASRLATEA